MDYESPLLNMPYALDCNDMRFVTVQGFHSQRQFHEYLKDCFDLLYKEGESHAKMMSMGLHRRIAGRPGWAGAPEESALGAGQWDAALRGHPRCSPSRAPARQFRW